MDQSKGLPALNEMDMTEALAGMVGSTKEVLERYHHCPICGARLHFSHSTDFSRNLTHETCKCPECGVRVRQVLHRLQ